MSSDLTLTRNFLGGRDMVWHQMHLINSDFNVTFVFLAQVL